MHSPAPQSFFTWLLKPQNRHLANRDIITLREMFLAENNNILPQLVRHW